MANVDQKKAVVDELSAKLKDARALYVTDFSGLNVKSMTDLRSRLRTAGVEYVVVKNTLVERAMSELDLPDIAEFFKGPTGLVIGGEDAVAAAKVLDDFAREHDNRPVMKVGIVERKAISASEIGRLAKLPPREQLLSELAGAFQAPLAQFVSVLQAKVGEVAGLLEALRSQKESTEA